jgi:hypothetical protein
MKERLSGQVPTMNSGMFSSWAFRIIRIILMSLSGKTVQEVELGSRSAV